MSAEPEGSGVNGDSAAIATLVDAMAPLLGLEIDAEARPRVIASLGMVAAAAQLVMAFPLDEVRDEPAGVFTPGSMW